MISWFLLTLEEGELMVQRTFMDVLSARGSTKWSFNRLFWLFLDLYLIHFPFVVNRKPQTVIWKWVHKTFLFIPQTKFVKAKGWDLQVLVWLSHLGWNMFKVRPEGGHLEQNHGLNEWWGQTQALRGQLTCMITSETRYKPLLLKPLNVV